jgi:hypothetical protein
MGSKWMVGVRFWSEAGNDVRHFYLVEGNISGAEARRAAAREAASDSEFARRQGAKLDEDWVQVQRVVQDDIGRIRLSAPLPDETTAVIPDQRVAPRGVLMTRSHEQNCHIARALDVLGMSGRC